ncbi:MAG: OprO/OprP family phosphate-selective porin [Phycisphaerales bacterium]|nr:OprO/OprP family phosphate-selective porin [Phycisphaerales bacterium]
MSLTTRFGLVAGTAAVALAGTAFGGTAADNDALAQIAELKNELAQLKAQNGEDWLTEQRAGEIRGIVQDVLVDAETRTSLQDSGAMAGWNNGFFLSSPDGNYKLKVGGLMQVRWVMNSAKEQNTEWGFENARTQLNFSGNIVDPSWTFRVRGDFARNGGAMGLDYAYVQKSMDNGLSFRVGQFKAPWMQENLVEDGYQLAVDRSVMSQAFGMGQGFSQGIQMGYSADAFRVHAYYGNGIGDSNGSWNGVDTNWSFAGRGEYKIAGTWDQFDDSSSFRGEDFGAMVGFAGMGQRYNGNGGGHGDGDKVYGITGDVTLDFGGASLFASGVWQQHEDAAGEKSNPWGFTAQGGYFVTEEIELFGRYEYITYDVTGDAGKYNGITLGMNYFFAKESCKVTVDWSMNLNSFGAAGGNLNNLGWRQDMSTSDKDQWALRAQLQLMF